MISHSVLRAEAELPLLSISIHDAQFAYAVYAIVVLAVYSIYQFDVGKKTKD